MGRPPLPKEPIPSAVAPPTSAQVAAAASAKAAAATSTAEESSRLLTSAAVSAAAGMVLAQADVAAGAAAVVASTAAPKGTRTNWSKEENLKRLTEAIFAWKNHMPPWESKLSLAGFAHKVRIPESTLGAYLNGKKYLGKEAHDRRPGGSF